MSVHKRLPCPPLSNSASTKGISFRIIVMSCGTAPAAGWSCARQRPLPAATAQTLPSGGPQTRTQPQSAQKNVKLLSALRAYGVRSGESKRRHRSVAKTWAAPEQSHGRRQHALMLTSCHTMMSCRGGGVEVGGGILLGRRSHRVSIPQHEEGRDSRRHDRHDVAARHNRHGCHPSRHCTIPYMVSLLQCCRR